LKNNHFEIKKPRWGLWMTLSFSAAIAGMFVAIEGITAIIYVAYAIVLNPNVNLEALLNALHQDGLFLSFSITATSLFCSGSIIFFSGFRRGITIKEYLYFNSVDLNIFLRWSIAILFYVLIYDGLSLALGRPIVPNFMITAYASAKFYPLFWFAIIILAPFLEELFFRGFFFEGLRESKLGALGAIAITSISWGLIHSQYGTFDIIFIIIMGAALGIAKIKTKSIYVPIAMHSFANLVATLEVAFLYPN